MIRFMLLLVLTTIAVALAGTATAAKPAVTEIVRPLHSEGVDPFLSDVCGFDVEVLNEARIRIIEFSDGTGQSHHHETYYFTANGKSLTDNDDFTIVFGPDETFAYHGVVFNIQVPGVGAVVVDAGKVVFDRDGNILQEAGLHQVLDGTANLAAMCDYLSGP